MYYLYRYLLNFFRLYIGNLPRNIIVTTVKNEFPKAVRVDVGFAQKVKETR